MKKIALILSVIVMVSSCGIFGKSGATNTTTASTTEASSDAVLCGQNSGQALKSLYNQYKIDGKINMNNFTNLSNIALLIGNIQELKEKKSTSGYIKDFTKGLVTGSTQLVNPLNQESVLTNLTQLANTNIDIQSLLESAKSSETAGKVENTVAKATDVANNASTIATSVSNILNLFK